MQTRSVLKLIIFSFLFVSGCSQQHEDEKFELIFTDFPRLGDVPNRPVLPNMEQINGDQKKLDQDQKEANKRKQEIFDSLGVDAQPEQKTTEQK